MTLAGVGDGLELRPGQQCAVEHLLREVQLVVEVRRFNGSHRRTLHQRIRVLVPQMELRGLQNRLLLNFAAVQTNQVYLVIEEGIIVVGLLEVSLLVGWRRCRRWHLCLRRASCGRGITQVPQALTQESGGLGGELAGA